MIFPAMGSLHHPQSDSGKRGYTFEWSQLLRNPPPHTHTHCPKTLQKLVSVRERKDKIETARKGTKGCRTRESVLLAVCLSTVLSPGAGHSSDPSDPELGCVWRGGDGQQDTVTEWGMGRTESTSYASSFPTHQHTVTVA